MNRDDRQPRLRLVPDLGPFLVRDADGRALGRYSLTGPLEPVPDVMAYTFEDAGSAKAVRGQFPGSSIEPVRIRS